jgi:hypothetical protein
LENKSGAGRLTLAMVPLVQATLQLVHLLSQPHHILGNEVKTHRQEAQ